MKQADPDWGYLRAGTLLPAATALIAATVLVISLWLYQTQQQQILRYSISQNHVHQDYESMVYRRNLIDRYHRRYQAFNQLGFVGRESRLDWIETLRATATQLKLPRLNYSIQPQMTAVSPVAAATQGSEVTIKVSQVKLELGLLHELDLLRFFDRLQQAAPGLITVERCELIRNSNDEDVLQLQPNIQANCAMRIYTAITSDVSRQVAQL